MNGAMTDFREIGEAQNKVLALSIDKVRSLRCPDIRILIPRLF